MYFSVASYSSGLIVSSLGTASVSQSGVIREEQVLLVQIEELISMAVHERESTFSVSFFSIFFAWTL
jgi:hypothetical protein